MSPRPTTGQPYQRADGLWCAVLNLPTDDTGRRRRKVYTARSKALAMRKRNAGMAELTRLGDLPTAGTTVGKWLDYWLDNIAAPALKPRTVATYRSYVRAWIRPHLGTKRLDALKPEHVRAMLTAMTEAGKPESTRAHAYAVLNTALTAGVDEGRMARNPLTRMRGKPRLRRPEAVTFSVAQHRAMLDTIAGGRLESRWWFALVYGLRQGESLGLRWSDVNLDAGTLTVSWSLTPVNYRHGCRKPCGRRAASCPARRLDIGADVEHVPLHGGLCLVRPKSETSKRTMPLIPEARGQLTRRYVDYLREREAPHYVDHGLVWGRIDGQPYSPGRDLREWKGLLEDAGMPSLRLHDARAAIVSTFTAAGVNITDTSVVAGHADTEVTTGYRQRDIETMRAALETGYEYLRR